jgi:hypothetical protein
MALTAFSSPLVIFDAASELDEDSRFDCANVMRTVSLVNVGDHCAAANKGFSSGTRAPSLPVDFNLTPSMFHTPLLADAAGNTLLACFAAIADVHVEKVNRKKCSIKACVDRGACSCCFKARIYQGENGRVVEFQRRSGDVLAFQVLFCSVAVALDPSLRLQLLVFPTLAPSTSAPELGRGQ